MVDREIIKFGIQATISVALMAFCITMVVIGKQQEVYLPLLTSTVAYWFPNPRLKKRISSEPVELP